MCNRFFFVSLFSLFLFIILDADNESTTIFVSEEPEEQQRQELIIGTRMTGGNDFIRNKDHHPALVTSTSNDNSMMNDSFNMHYSSTELPAIKPYGFQLESRRRLNTLERMRERRQSRMIIIKILIIESLDTNDEQQQQRIQKEYALKPEEVQDPIIRRALERFSFMQKSNLVLMLYS